MKSSLPLAAAIASLVFAAAPGASAAALNILFVANNNLDTAYQTFASSGQFAGSTWTHKLSGLTGNDIVGGDLDRTATFTGFNGGNPTTVKSYLESFSLVIIGLPVSSGNFVDGALGADWAGINAPILFHPMVATRALGGRPGMTSGDNFINLTLGTEADTLRVSNSPLSDALFAGTSSQSDLYAAATVETVNGIATYGTGELIASVTSGTANHHGIIYWWTGSTNAAGHTLNGNRAFMPLNGNISSLNADGQIVLGNVISQLTAIPEPTTYAALLGLGALGVAAARRRRHRR
jgi:hypothetical protein